MPEPPASNPAGTPAPITMTRDEFKDMMKEQLATQEKQLTEKLNKKETPETSKSPEFDAMKQKIADLEKQLSTRTTATRDMVKNTDSPTGAPRTKEEHAARVKIIGAAMVKMLRDNPDENFHASYIVDTGA